MSKLNSRSHVRVGKVSFEEFVGPPDYCGMQDARDKEYYCIKRMSHQSRHRYGVILEWQYSGRTLSARDMGELGTDLF